MSSIIQNRFTQGHVHYASVCLVRPHENSCLSHLLFTMGHQLELPESIKNLEVIDVSIRDNIVIVSYNNRESKVNCYSAKCNDEVQKVFNFIAENKEVVRGTVVTSAKVDNFFAGVDIKELNTWDAEFAHFISNQGQTVLKLFSEYEKPSVAVVMGSCLGAGFELANSCHYRIAIDTPATIFGLPEVMLGVIPAATGTVYTPRRHNFQVAMDMMLTGKSFNSKKAKALGIVDEVREVHPAGLQATLATLEQIGIETIVKMEKGIVREKSLSWSEWFFLKALENVGFCRSFVFNKMRNEVMKKTKGLYPAPFVIIDVLETSFRDGIDAGLEAESDSFSKITQSREAKSLLQVLNNQIHCKKNHFLNPGVDSPIVKKVKLTVDSSSFESETVKKFLESKDLQVVDGQESKDVLKIFCSLFKLADEPCFRFFSPLSRSPLVEVITKDSSETSKAVQLGLNLNKIVIVTRGHYCTRLFMVMVIDTLDIILNYNLTIHPIEELYKEIGFSVDVLRQMDEVGIDVIITIWEHFMQSPSATSSLQAICKSTKSLELLKAMNGKGFKGSKAGAGWFKYIDGRVKEVNSDVNEVVKSSAIACQSVIDEDFFKDRLLSTIINEAASCLENGILTNPTDGDVGAVFGIAFPPLLVGPFHFIDLHGAERVIQMIEHCNEKLSQLAKITPCKILSQRINSSEKFHGKK